MIPLELHAYDITIDDCAVDHNGDEHTEIQIWGFNKLSEPILARVKDFPVFCKAELPPIFSRAGHIIRWNSDNAQEIIHLIRKKLSSKEIEEPVSIKFIKSYKLYYYTGGKKYPFLFFTFNTIKHMREVANKARFLYSSDYGKIELKFYETKIDIYNKMFSHRKVSSTERFICQARELSIDDEDRISKAGPPDRPFKEYIIDWKTIDPLPKDSPLWFTYPIVMSFDIETYSHNHRAFPQKHYFEDIIFSISITLQTFMKPETKRDIMIIIGPTKKVEGVETHYVKDEIEVLEKFFELVEILDPDVFIGYNIFGFDYDYMNARLEDVGMCWKNIGRLQNVDCSINELSWNSSAYGFQKLRVFNCPGRISVDMLPYIKRDHKLPMYNLSAVGKHFLGEEKFDLKPWEMFAVHKEMMDCLEILEELTGENDYLEGVKKLKSNIKNYPLGKVSRIVKAIEKNTLIVKYNVQDTYLVTRLFEKLNVWISLIELASIFRVTPMDLFTRGQQKRCIAQLYHAASHKNIVLTTRNREFIFLSGGYVSQPKVGFWPLAICFDFNSLYPSIMIAYNICFTTLLPTLKDVDKDKYHHFHINQEEPKSPKPPKDDNFDYGEYDEDYDTEKDKIVGEKVHREYDFGFIKQDVQKGLLPEILADLLASRKNVKKKMKGINKRVDTVDVGILEPYRKNKDIKVKDIVCKKAKAIFKEYFPDSKDEDSLRDYDEKLNKEFFSMKVNSGILDSRQLGLKISANSLYGFTGAQVVGEFSLPEATMCVTSRGRELIINSGLYFEKHYGATVVYGDTDSTMVYVPSLTDYTKIYEVADMMEKDINGHGDIKDEEGNIIKPAKKGIFPPPLNLEFEKAMRALFMKKKHYAYMEYASDGTIIKEKNSDRENLNVKGIILARRDNCQWIRKTYENVIRTIFRGEDISVAFSIIIDAIIDVIELKFDITHELSIIKSMGSNYKSRTYPLAIFSELTKEVGRPVNPGERFPFVVVNDHQGRDKMGYKMRTNELFLEQWESTPYKYGDKVPEDFKSSLGLYPPEEIDSFYYINNVLMAPIDKLFEYGYLKVIEKYEPYGYEPRFNNRLRRVSVKTPVKMVILIIKDMMENIKKNNKKDTTAAKEVVKDLVALKEWFKNIEFKD